MRESLPNRIALSVEMCVTLYLLKSVNVGAVRFLQLGVDTELAVCAGALGWPRRLCEAGEREQENGHSSAESSSTAAFRRRLAQSDMDRSWDSATFLYAAFSDARTITRNCLSRFMLSGFLLAIAVMGLLPSWIRDKSQLFYTNCMDIVYVCFKVGAARTIAALSYRSLQPNPYRSHVTKPECSLVDWRGFSHWQNAMTELTHKLSLWQSRLRSASKPTLRDVALMHVRVYSDVIERRQKHAMA